MGRRSMLQVPTRAPDMLTTALHALEAATAVFFHFQQGNEKILQRASDLAESVALAREAVSIAAKTMKRSAESEHYSVKYGKTFTRWYDAEELIAGLVVEMGEDRALSLIEAVGLVTTTKEVDEKVLRALIEAEKIPEKIAKAAFKEKQKSERCEITAKIAKPNEEES